MNESFQALPWYLALCCVIGIVVSIGFGAIALVGTLAAIRQLWDTRAAAQEREKRQIAEALEICKKHGLGEGSVTLMGVVWTLDRALTMEKEKNGGHAKEEAAHEASG